jgi:hypothetical protein
MNPNDELPFSESTESEEPDYTGHKDQLVGCGPTAEDIEQLQKSLLSAYASVIDYREVPFIRFGDLNAEELAQAFSEFPRIIKPTLTCINVAQRALARDLGFSFDPYAPKITPAQASILAGYIKPMLPPAIAVPALMELDRFFWTDKEMRALKGNWEVVVTDAINSASDCAFRKRKFSVAHDLRSDSFEIDAAYPATGEIQVAVDVKRIESRRDIHKRADEIINKAVKFKSVHPKGKFVVVIYYPFPTEHINVQSRLQSADIDGVYFAGASKSSIANAVSLLVGQLGLKKKEPEVVVPEAPDDPLIG